jgi:plasmid replication initiation protein
MNSDEKIEVLKAREYIVSKSNQIVQKSRYNFSVTEQRTIAYICSKIKPVDVIDRAKGTPFQLEYEFNILDYCRTCGIQDNGRQYEDVKATLKGLRDKSMWLTLPDGSETTVGWLAKATTNKRNGIAKIRIDEDLAPYLFDLQSKFLSYGLKNILNMKSQYSIRLYELLKSHYDMKVGQTDHRNNIDKAHSPKKISWIVDLDEFKKLLMIENQKSYNNFAEFKRRVLVPSQKEINELTDISVYFEPITKGRKTIKLKIDIVSKLPMDKWLADKKNDEMLASCEVNERLDTPKKKVQKRNNMTPEDKERYRRATENAEQMDLFQGGMEE